MSAARLKVLGNVKGYDGVWIIVGEEVGSAHLVVHLDRWSVRRLGKLLHGEVAPRQYAGETLIELPCELERG